MKIPRSLLLLFLLTASAFGAVDGFGPWRFGMSKKEVAAVENFGPYKEVRSTGGVETANAVWNGGKTNASFVFERDALAKIQIWAYEGKDQESALDAWIAVAEYLQETFGPVELQGLQNRPPATDEVAVRLSMKKFLTEARRDTVAKVQMGLKAMPSGASVFASFFRHPEHGFYVFLYYTKA